MLLDGKNEYSKVTALSKSNLQSQYNSHQNSNDILKEVEKVILIFLQKYKRCQLANVILSKMDVAGGIMSHMISSYSTE